MMRRMEEPPSPTEAAGAPSRGTVRAAVVPESPLVKRLWRGGQVLAAAAVGMVGLGAALHAPGVAVAAYFVGVLGAAAAGVTSLFLRARGPSWEKRSTDAVASAEGLRLGDAALVPHDELLDAVVTPRGQASMQWPFRRGAPPAWAVAFARRLGLSERVEVELKRRGFRAWPVRFATRTVEEARAIVDALGLGVRRRAMTRKVASPAINPKVTFPAIFGGMALMILGAFLGQAVHPAFGAVAMAFPLGVVGVFVFGLVKKKITVGADGVTVQWLGRPQTISLDDVARVEIIPAEFVKPAVVRLVRKRGPPFDIVVGLRGGNLFEPFVVTAECERIAERVKEAMALGQDAKPVEFRTWAEHRATLPIAEWVAVLRGAVQAYRDEGSLPFSTADLWSVLENTRASAAERVAAAVAVTATPDERTRARLRDVAASTALPRLRVALEAAAEADDAKLTRVLEELRIEEMRRPREMPVDSSPAPAVRVRVGAGDDPSAVEEADAVAESTRAARERANTGREGVG